MGYLFLKSEKISSQSFSFFKDKCILLPSSKYFVAGIVAITTKINLFDNLNKSSIKFTTSFSGICSITSVHITPSNLLSGYLEYSFTPRSYKYICLGSNSDKFEYSVTYL